MVDSEIIPPIIIKNTSWFLIVKRLIYIDKIYSTDILMISDITGGS
jgi:hypothetical protein